MMLCATHANAEITGNNLLQWCNAAVKYDEKVEMTKDERTDGIMCMYYLNGFVSSLQITTELYKPRRALTCIPSDGSMYQIARLVVKQLKNRPEDLHKEPGLNVALALATAFPCK
jgi:hypothetical protein